MVDFVLLRDLGSYLQAAPASSVVSATAGGAGNNVVVDGLTIDRFAFNLPHTAVFELAYQTTLAASQTLSINSVSLQHSPDGSTWTAYSPVNAVMSPGVVATGAGTFNGVAAVSAYLGSAQRYVRLLFTPDLSATATDTATVVAVAIMAGTDHAPAP